MQRPNGRASPCLQPGVFIQASKREGKDVRTCAGLWVALVWDGEYLYFVMDVYESRLSVGNWMEMGWRGLKESSVKWLPRGREEKYAREYLQAVPLPKCPFAICHHEFKVRQVIIFGCFSPVNFRCYPHPAAPLFSLALSVSPARFFHGNLCGSPKSRSGPLQWFLLPLYEHTIIVHLCICLSHQNISSQKAGNCFLDLFIIYFILKFIFGWVVF